MFWGVSEVGRKVGEKGKRGVRARGSTGDAGDDDEKKKKGYRKSMRSRGRVLALVAGFLFALGAPFDGERSQRGAGMRIGGEQGPRAGGLKPERELDLASSFLFGEPIKETESKKISPCS